MIQKFAAAALALSMAYTAQAAVDIDAIRYEDTAVVQSANLQLNGAGLRKKVFFKVYAAGLYVPVKADSAEAILTTSRPRALSRPLRRASKTTRMRPPARPSPAKCNPSWTP